MVRLLPKYPIFVPSKGRADLVGICAYFAANDVDFRVVVEPQEVEAYAAKYGVDRILVLPESHRGLVYVRNWIRDYSQANGDKRHWQFDDNIRNFRRVIRGKQIPCDPALAIRVCEDFADTYKNVGLAGFNYDTFVAATSGNIKPFRLNQHIYSCTLMRNDLPYRFRGFANEDVDICLQVLAGGECTVLVNAFTVTKPKTMTQKGGNNTDIYEKQDSRLKVTRHLERRWPGVVTTIRRFGRPHHKVSHEWQRFDTQLIRDPDFTPSHYNEVVRAEREIKSSVIKGILEHGTGSKPKRASDADTLEPLE